MTDDELTTTDVLFDPEKNLCNLIKDNDANDTDNENIDSMALQENLYYTETEFIDFLENGSYSCKDNLTLISLNIANLFSKLNSLKNLLRNLKESKPDIIVIVETHISYSPSSGHNKDNLRDLIPGYTFFHEGRKVRRGGGVGILVSDRLNSESVTCNFTDTGVTFVEEKFENVVIKIPGCIKSKQTHEKDLIIVALYRQPDSGNIDDFLGYLDTLSKKLNKPRNKLVLAGDMNLDLLRYESHPSTAKYLDIMTNHGTIPRIVRPTRIKNQSATLIDHIFTHHSLLVLVSGILDIELAGSSGFTDHKPTFTIIKAEPQRNPPRRSIEISYFSKTGHRQQREELMTHDWDGTLTETDPNVVYDQLTATYSHYYHSNLSKKTISSNSRRVEGNHG